MTSNALTKQNFSYKPPAICKPPPWPPMTPPPPLTQAKFWASADIVWRHWLFPTSYAASCYCTYDPIGNYWTGKSSSNPEHERIQVQLNIDEPNKRWYAQVVFSWPDSPGWGWETDYGPLEDRPYQSGLLQESVYVPVWKETSIVMQEVPS